MNDLVTQAKETLSSRVEAIQDPTPAYSMRHFVVDQHDTDGMRWSQALLELDNRLMAIAIADIDAKIGLVKINYFEGTISKKEATKAIRLLKAEKIRIELLQVERARLGTLRGVGHLLPIIAELEEKHGGPWTREQIDEEMPEYWSRRAQRQAIQDLNFHGKVGIGNQDMLRMMGHTIDPPQEHVAAVERRFLECGNVKILTATPTLIPRDEIKTKGLRCLEGWGVPGTFQNRYYAVQGKPIADAYNDAARTALEDGADFLLCVEDDHVIPAGTFERLWNDYQQFGPRCIVGAWYPQKKEPRTGAAIVLRGGKREYLSDDDETHEVYAVTQGFTLIPTAIFREIHPHERYGWFVTTGCVTQDSFFSQLAREAGWKLLVDTSARIQHVCRETGRVYE